MFFEKQSNQNWGKSCPDEAMSFEVARFGEGWISRYKAEHKLSYYLNVDLWFLIIAILLFGGAWFWLKKCENQ